MKTGMIFKTLIPKGTNFLKVTPEELAEATFRINHFEKDILNEKSVQEVLLITS